MCEESTETLDMVVLQGDFCALAPTPQFIQILLSFPRGSICFKRGDFLVPDRVEPRHMTSLRPHVFLSLQWAEGLCLCLTWKVGLYSSS